MRLYYCFKKGKKTPAISNNIKITNNDNTPARIEIAAYQCMDDEVKEVVDTDACSLIKS